MESAATDPIRHTSSDVRTILVVEDEELQRQTLAEYLGRQDHRVLAAPDAERALELIDSEGAVDIVLTDIRLPGNSGLELLEHLRRAQPHCSVVLMTGYASLDYALTAIRLGAYDYLTKPFQLEELQVILDRLELESRNHAERCRLEGLLSSALAENEALRDELQRLRLDGDRLKHELAARERDHDEEARVRVLQLGTAAPPRPQATPEELGRRLRLVEDLGRQGVFAPDEVARRREEIIRSWACG